MIIKTKIKLTPDEVKLYNFLSETDWKSETLFASELGTYKCWTDVAFDLEKYGLIGSNILDEVGGLLFRKHTAQELKDLDVEVMEDV